MIERFNEGDEVYVYSSGYRALRKAVVVRVTKTQAVVESGRAEQRFNRETGRLIGGDTWNMSRIDHPTPALDKQWLAERVDGARRHLAQVAAKSDAAEIRAAFERWDELERTAAPSSATTGDTT
jgi:hypothetical protein